MKTESELHIIARKLVSDEFAGRRFDKKMLRYNDIVTVGLRYQSEIARPGSAEDGIREAVQCCVVGHDMHVKGRGPLTLLEAFDQWL